eukprot:GEMP01013054.1.p1 GENE.GEMP01013054.1~~GEMP01013054.1.p1  ORF type:complete len:397 (+),score=23.41 GEMP01013054.1:35-1192(+)
MGEVHLHPLIVRALVSPHLSLDYPFQLNEPLTRNAEGYANGNSKSPSARTLLRACWALLEGSFYLTFPLTVIFLAWKSFLNDVPLVVVGIMLVAGFRDEMTKRAMGWTSSVLPGLYFNDSEENRKIVEKWDKSKRTYKAPPTCWSGDASTILPFLMNKSVMIESVRTWLRVPQDEKEGCEIRDEVIALDWFMPADCDVRAIVLILHGLNGGSEEPYVKDFIKRATELGYCSVVMIARGMQQTPVRTDRIFNGARVSDAFLTSQVATISEIYKMFIISKISSVSEIFVGGSETTPSRNWLFDGSHNSLQHASAERRSNQRYKICRLDIRWREHMPGGRGQVHWTVPTLVATVLSLWYSKKYEPVRTQSGKASWHPTFRLPDRHAGI